MTRALVLTLLVACGNDNPNYPPELPLPDEYRTCQVDADCTIVELGVCDHCNGGMAAAVSVDKEADALETYGETPPKGDDWGCTLMDCAQFAAECIDDLCEAIEQPLSGSTR